ncbi:MAG TPA: PVC-type heme-binding CxxCH protein [Gemmataceae bacterium]|jgi:quinoprotein glucose dehydrogenase|nr:PVC-type heme-binding CxxCH protein [Gemmataceae bacterium]
MRLSRLLPLTLLPAVFAIASPEAPPKSDYNPPLAKASDEAEKAIPRFQRDKSLKVEVWAAEPMLANPVCFAFDEKGRCFVAETFRLHHGVTDDRGHMNWLEDDLASRSTADRVAIYKKDAKNRFHEQYEKERERIRLLEDTTGSGRADKSTVFSDDFGRAEDGIGAGLLARKGNVYYTNIPDLWLLKDTKGTGTADVKKSLATGFGIHTSFIGHDLHGLRIGPDGRLYFSIGDRGLNVTTKEGKHLFVPDTGAVLRCELDGSNLEVFCTGLRNPQELAFDDYGNLFTVDNNSDSGDQARFLHLVEGGEYGWRIGYQYETAMHDKSVKQGNRGPWNYEQLWNPKTEAAYLIPAIRNFSNGPSGFTAYPGVGLAERYKGHFFLANFSGGPGNSGIFSFAVRPKGASFEMTDDHKFLWEILATDCEFGPDGAFYVSDWVNGWNLPGKGRIYKVTDPDAMKDPKVEEARKLIAEGFDGKSVEELIKLLGHVHRGVRMEAQLSLAAKGKEAIKPLRDVAADQMTDRLARVHAIWGLGMIHRQSWRQKKVDREYAQEIAQEITEFEVLLKDRDPEIRAQAVRILGDQLWLLPFDTAVRDLLSDRDPRVRSSTALAFGHAAIPFRKANKINEQLRSALFNLIWKADEKDAYLRHAGIFALAQCIPASLMTEAVSDERHEVRLAVTIALRRQKSPEVAAFLADSDPKIVAEAARAINDELITAALPKLAEFTAKPNVPPVVAFRALNARLLLGRPEDATALAAYAARSDAPDVQRALALKMLGDWASPPRRDFITGLTQKIEPRPANVAVEALTGVLGKVFAAPDAVRKEATAVASKLGVKQVGPFLVGLVTDTKAPTASRVDALRALEALKDPKLPEATTTALASTDPRLRTAARGVAIKKDAAGVLKQFRDVLAGTDLVEQQGAFSILAVNPSADADALVEEWLDKFVANKTRPELALDILEAAGASKSERIKRRLAGFENARPKDDLGKYREALAGGDAANGRNLFLTKVAVECQRCHKLDGQGGEVGPPLNGVGKQTRDYLLESIVVPSKAIAKGYESVLIVTLDGKTVSGVLKSEDDKEVRVMTAEGKLVVVKKADIDDRRATKSAMPDDLAGKLTKRELRDLVEFLSGLKEEWKK